MSSNNIQFGSGAAVFVPNNANAALMTANTPLFPNLLQEQSVDFKADQKELYGRLQYAIAVARGKIKASGKGKIATQDPMMLNQLFFGMPATAGTLRPVESEAHVLAASSAATVQATNHANYKVDYGIIDGNTGNLFKRIISGSPQVGEYSVDPSTGTYTFNSAETATSILASYGYTDSTKGQSIVISNQRMGYSPQFQMNLFNYFNGKLFALTLNSCTMTDISIPTKQDDFWVSDFSYSIAADAAGNVGTIYAD